MARFPATSFQKGRPEAAFAFYAEVDANGKRRSNNEIARMVGVSASAVAYWKAKHNWDARLFADVKTDLLVAETTNQAINKLLRDGLLQHIQSLSHIIAYSKSDPDKIAAIKAFVHVAKELGVLTPGVGTTDLVPPTTFTDDIPHAQRPTAQEGELPEGIAGEDSAAGGAGGLVGEPVGI